MKCLPVPFFKQTLDYTCGPASLRMVLAYFDIQVLEEVLAKELGTNDAVGTERDRMGSAIHNRKLIPHEKTDAVFSDLQEMFKQGLPSIVRFSERQKNEDHYGVVVGIDSKKIVIHDPWSGPEDSYDLADFFVRWPCPYVNGQTCWLLGVGPESV